MRSRFIAGSLLVLLLPIVAGPPSAVGDQFDEWDGPKLKKALGGAGLARRPSLSVADIGAMPAHLPDTRSAFVLARTDLGNVARLLLVPELRKPAASGPAPAMAKKGEMKGEMKPPEAAEPVPVLVVERLEAFDASNPASRIASRRDVVLFDGMPIDLDSGQVVPPGFGGDLVFRAGGEGGPRLEPIEAAELFTWERAPEAGGDREAAARPSPGRSILPTDFAGRFRLFANGQWSGTLDLKVDAKGVATGRFRSDLLGNGYDVTGQVAREEPNKLRFTIALPRATQEFDAYLYGEGKGAMAGTLSLLGRTFGFFAIRDGGRYAPEGFDLGPLQALDRDRPGMIAVNVLADGSTLVAGRPVPVGGLVEAIRAAGAALGGDEHWVSIVAEVEAKVAQVVPAVEAAKGAGVSTVRIQAVAREKGLVP